jgi:hypothetical protein
MLSEPSVVAIDTTTNAVVAVGSEAKLMMDARRATSVRFGRYNTVSSPITTSRPDAALLRAQGDAPSGVHRPARRRLCAVRDHRSGTPRCQ